MSEFVFWEGMELSREEGEIQINRRHGHGNGHGVMIEHEHEDMMTAGTGSMDGDNNGYKKLVVRYRECLKNHAAGMGGNATDGCGEFMASGEEGTIEALICSACHCHRNFHRKELEGNPQPHPHSSYHYFHPANTTTRLNIKPSRTIPPLPLSLPLPLPHQHQMIMPYNIGIGHSESDEQGDQPYPRPTSGQLVMKKRFRTKFSQEQKDKMFNFAQKVGWKIQKQEDSVVQHFCQEIGVKRRVLKVWMHNNKHNLAKNNPTTTTTTTTTSPP